MRISPREAVRRISIVFDFFSPCEAECSPCARFPLLSKSGIYTLHSPLHLGSELYIYTWKADFSQLRNQKVKPKMAEFEAILVRHPQSPTRTVKYIAVQPCT